MRLKFNRGKGVSPIISIFLMAIIVASAFGVLYAFVLDYTANRKLYFTQFFQNATEEVQERFIIEDVWFTPENETHIYVRNVGRIAINITTVTINETSIPVSLYLSVGEHDWLNLPKQHAHWNHDTTYHIVVETSRGNTLEGYYRSPKQ